MSWKYQEKCRCRDFPGQARQRAARGPLIWGSKENLTCALQGFPDKGELGSGVRFAFLEGDPADLAVLGKAEAGSAAAVVVAGMGERGAKEADALVLTTLLLVQVGLLPRLPAHSARQIAQ